MSRAVDRGLNIMLGAIVMSLAGPTLLILAGLTAWFAYSQGPADHLNIAGYYACFWVPAGVISTVGAGELGPAGLAAVARARWSGVAHADGRA